jgi:hypothetical protein
VSPRPRKLPSQDRKHGGQSDCRSRPCRSILLALLHSSNRVRVICEGVPWPHCAIRAGSNEQPESALHYAVSPFRDRDAGVVPGSGVGFWSGSTSARSQIRSIAAYRAWRLTISGFDDPEPVFVASPAASTKANIGPPAVISNVGSPAPARTWTYRVGIVGDAMEHRINHSPVGASASSLAACRAQRSQCRRLANLQIRRQLTIDSKSADAACNS